MTKEMERNELMGERLQKLRNQSSLTQEELAERLDVSRQSVSKWELNKTLPDVDKLIQLSEIYQVSIDYLIKGEEVKEEGKQEGEEEGIELVGKDDAAGETSGTEKEGEETSNTEKEEEETSKEDKDVIVKQVILLICILLSGLLCLCSIAFVSRMLINNAFDRKDVSQSVVNVTKIYEQYTKAEIGGDEFNKEIVWLDVPGVREGDYVFCYMDGERPSFQYYSKSLILPMIFGVVFLIFFIVFIMEWQMHRANRRSVK